MVGEAQGVLTAMKALTEGFGPLLVSSLLHVFEGSSFPGAPWLLCAASVGVAAVLSLRLESTIEAHAATSSPHMHMHSGGYDAEPAGAGRGEEEGVKLQDRLSHDSHGAPAGGESRDGLMQGTVASHAGAREVEQPAPGKPSASSAAAQVTSDRNGAAHGPHDPVPELFFIFCFLEFIQNKPIT